jgi:pyridoxine/pyridoxamine 5'-phosphate oxidase
MEKALLNQVESILETANEMTLATVRPDGFPQATTVSFVNVGLNIFFGCREQSQKARNLAHNCKVSIAISLPYAAWDQIRGLSIGGIAKRVSSKSEANKVSRLLLKKSPETSAFAPYGMVGVVFFKIVPKVIALLDYSKGLGYSTVMDVGGHDR